jgi:hypothetical protein
MVCRFGHDTHALTLIWHDRSLRSSTGGFSYRDNKAKSAKGLLEKSKMEIQRVFPLIYRVSMLIPDAKMGRKMVLSAEFATYSALRVVMSQCE